MAEFTIYNTNRVQVYSEDPVLRENDKIEDFINNSIEYYINTKKNRIIALVRADAPQVEGRDKANFYVDFSGSQSPDLATQLVSRLKQHESDTEWSFHTDEKRWSIPWAVTDYEIDDPAELEYDVGRLLAIQNLIEDRESLDFGFSDYEYASAVLNYYLSNSNGSTFAIASNGRKKIIQSVDLVLEPGRYSNFEVINDYTQNKMSQRIKELRADTKSFYADETTEVVKSIANADELTPIMALEDLHALDRYTSNQAEFSTLGINAHSEEVQITVDRLEALQNGEQIESAPPTNILDPDTRKRSIARIAKIITDEKTSLIQEVDDILLNNVDENLISLSENPVDSAFDAITVLEDRVVGNRLEANTSYQAVNDILDHLSEIGSTDVLESKKESIEQSIYVRISEEKSEIKDRAVSKFKSRIVSWISELPDKTTSRAVLIAVRAEILDHKLSSLDKLRDFPQPVSDHKLRFNKLVNRIEANEMLDEQRQERLQEHFTKNLCEYKNSVRKAHKKEMRRRIAGQIDNTANQLSQKREYTVLSQRSYIFVNGLGIKYQALRPFRDIMNEIRSSKLLLESDKIELKKNLKKQIDNRVSAIEEQARDDLIKQTNKKRDQFIESKRDESGIRHAISKLDRINKYIKSEHTAQSLPDDVTGEYLLNLKLLKESKAPAILNEQDIPEIRDTISQSRLQKARKLIREHNQNVQEYLIRKLDGLNDRLSEKSDLKVKLFRKYKAYLNGEVALSDHRAFYDLAPPDYEDAIEGILTTADNIKDSELVRPGVYKKVNSKLEKLIRTAQDNVFENSIEDISNYINQEFNSENGSINELSDNINILNNIKNEMKQNSVSGTIPAETEQYFKVLQPELLTPAQESKIHDKILTDTSAMIDELRTQQIKSFDAEFKAEVESVRSEYSSPVIKIRAAQELKTLFDSPSHYDSVHISNTLFESSRLLSDELLDDYRQQADANMQDLIEQQIKVIVQDIKHDLENLCITLDRPMKAMHQFERHINDKSHVRSETRLGEVCEKFDQVKELYESEQAITQEVFERAKSQLTTEAKNLKQSNGPDKKLDEIKSKISISLYRT